MSDKTEGYIPFPRLTKNCGQEILTQAVEAVYQRVDDDLDAAFLLSIGIKP